MKEEEFNVLPEGTCVFTLSDGEVFVDLRDNPCRGCTGYQHQCTGSEAAEPERQNATEYRQTSLGPTHRSVGRCQHQRWANELC